MKAVVIGGTGHIGSFLTPQLVEAGWEVVVVSSGRRAVDRDAFPPTVEFVKLTYDRMLADGSFRDLLADRRPDAVVDILQSDAPGVFSACEEVDVGHLVFCGSLWMLGRPKVVPTPEIPQTECPFDGYRRRFEQLLAVVARSDKDTLAVSAVMPPNICGPGKIPLDGKGGRSIEVHREHQRGVEVCLPFPGTNLIGPCDAEDVARGFACVLGHGEASAGEIFNVGSAYALTAERFIDTYADIYGTPIPIRYVDPTTFARDVLPDPGANYHFLEHMCPDISKISARVGYSPAYTPEETMERAVRWMRDKQVGLPF